LVNYDAADVQELWSIGTMTKKEQEPVFKEWINARDITSAGVSQGYGLRIGPNKGWVALCQNSFKNMLHLRRKRWNTLYCTRLRLGSNIHKNMGNTNAAVSQETNDSVVSYLTDIAKQFVESYATRCVRMLTKFKLREGEKGIIDLPNSITKRNLFEKWCFLRGWKAILDNIGDYKFEERNTKETFWEECDTLKICSWWKFRDLWNRHLPHVCIRTPCYETCGKCTIFKNAFRYR
jgi:hypothetical protein